MALKGRYDRARYASRSCAFGVRYVDHCMSFIIKSCASNLIIIMSFNVCESAVYHLTTHSTHPAAP
jgi:hypothetical protein